MTNKTSLAFTPQNLLKRVHRHTTARDYGKRQTIFSQGEKADAMFYIRNGNVKLTVVSNRGKKAVIAIFGQGDFFGEGCLANNSLRMSTATAIQPSTIDRLKRATIVRIIHEEPAFAKLFISYLLSRIGRVEDELVDQIFNSSEKRLARILLLLAGVGPQSKPMSTPTLLKVSQETLAEMVGTTRSRVSYFMNRFRERGFIDYNGTLRVHKSLLTFLLDQ